MNFFNLQLKEGQKGENDYINFVKKCYPNIIIYKANITEQRKGFDYKIKDVYFDIKIRNSKYYEIQDILLEIISVDNQNILGWFYTSIADIIVYMFQGINDFYYLYLDNLRDYINDKIDSFNIVSAPNISYNTISIIVPIKDIPSNCIEKINIFKLPTRKYIKRLNSSLITLDIFK